MAVNLNKAKFRILGTNEPPPDGFVCLGERWPAKGKIGRDRERIRRGIVAGKVDAFRRMRFSGDDGGPIYVNEAQAAHYLRGLEHRVPPTAKASQHDTTAGDAFTPLVHVFERMIAAAERLADAAESIATQPKSQQPELLQAFSDNGYHS